MSSTDFDKLSSFVSNVQSDWSVDATSNVAGILNKPTFSSLTIRKYLSGTYNEVVYGPDSGATGRM